MKSKLIGAALMFAAVIIGISVYFAVSDKNGDSSGNDYSQQIIELNEIESLARRGDSALAADKAAELKDSLSVSENRESGHGRTAVYCIISLIFTAAVFLYVWFAILRPFDKLKDFADNIAAGRFDIPLKFERTNYFGSFTWAFDSMRREITKARACEREAIDNNKTVIATLSHDIKTPVASIRAYAEGLEANMDSTPEKREKYLSVIMRKCDEVSKLTNDLFLHSVSDLEKLRIEPEDTDLCSLIEQAVTEIDAGQGDVHLIAPDFTATVRADSNRLIQIAENLINNSRKYAGTRIDVTLTRDDSSVSIHFRDYGPGIPDEDMPFIFDKFYRGRNCADAPGSGLGLFIVKYIAKRSGGDIMLINLPDGLDAVVTLPLADKQE